MHGLVYTVYLSHVPSDFTLTSLLVLLFIIMIITIRGVIIVNPFESLQVVEEPEEQKQKDEL